MPAPASAAPFFPCSFRDVPTLDQGGESCRPNDNDLSGPLIRALTPTQPGESDSERPITASCDQQVQSLLPTVDDLADSIHPGDSTGPMNYASLPDKDHVLSYETAQSGHRGVDTAGRRGGRVLKVGGWPRRRTPHRNAVRCGEITAESPTLTWQTSTEILMTLIKGHFHEVTALSIQDAACPGKGSYSLRRRIHDRVRPPRRAWPVPISGPRAGSCFAT